MRSLMIALQAACWLWGVLAAVILLAMAAGLA